MILADTSVWVRHLRQTDLILARLLDENLILIHPFIIGELACGNLKNRNEILGHLGTLPMAKTADHDEVLRWVESQKLAGKGLGWIDAHLLAAASLSEAEIWTLDKCLQRAADHLKIQYKDY
jgi:predicted nucleic acid-binding protein